MKSFKKLFGVLIGLGFVFLVSGPAAAVTEKLCAVMVEREDGYFSYYNTPEFSVLKATKEKKEFEFDHFSQVKDGEIVVGFSCIRSSIIPAKNDYKVLEAGYTFVIGAAEPTLGVLIKLEIIDGQYSFEVIQGGLDEKHIRKIEKRLAEFQALYDQAPAE